MLLSLLFLAAVPASAQVCAGDCNGDGEVGLGEVQVAFNVFLGTADLAACDEADQNGDLDVALGEVQSAFNRFLAGCTGNPDELNEVRASSTTALSSLRGVVSFGRLGAATAVGGGGALDPLGIGAAGSGGGFASGCFSGPCEVSGFLDCFCGVDSFGVPTLQAFWTSCSFIDDETEALVVVNGSQFLQTEEPNLCFGAPLFGVSFDLRFDQFDFSIQDANGNFQGVRANYFERFRPFSPSCFPERLDPLAYAARGEGDRRLDGSIQTFVQESFAVTTDVTTTAIGIVNNVSFFEGVSDCAVDVIVDGTLVVGDAVAGTEFRQTFQALGIVEVPQDDFSYLIDVNGPVTTDCLGGVDFETSESLRVLPTESCPTAGRLVIGLQSDGTRAAISFEDDGGVAFDLDADGSIEERRASCLDLGLERCGFEQPAGVCDSCSGGGCGSNLICSPCVVCVDGADTRCAPPDDFVSCGGNVY